MSEPLVYKGSLAGHSGWITAIATSPENPDMILTASRGEWGFPRRVSRRRECCVSTLAVVKPTWSKNAGMLDHGYATSRKVDGLEIAIGLMRDASGRREDGKMGRGNRRAIDLNLICMPLDHLLPTLTPLRQDRHRLATHP